jgi:alkylation response protein AidB-like acyl-CoA dehydrogenase
MARPITPVAGTTTVVEQYDETTFPDLVDAVHEGAFERERDNIPPYEAIDLVRKSRFGACRLPHHFGGAQGSLRQLLAMIVSLAEADPNVAHILRAHFTFVESQLFAVNEFERSRWLGEIGRGMIFGSATTELGTGTTGGLNTSRFNTRLTSKDGHFVLSGTKYYSTGSLYSDLVAVTALTTEDEIVNAVVPVNREGVQLLDDWDGMGQRLTASGTSHFDHVVVYGDEIIRRNTRNQLGAYQTTFAQLYLTAIIAGIAKATTRDAVSLVRRRGRTFSHASSETPSEDPLLQHVVGQLATNAYAAEAIVASAAGALDDAARSVEEGKADPGLLLDAALAAAKAKVAVDEIALRSGALIFDVGGGSATKREANLDRHWRNVRTIASHNPDLYKTRAVGDFLLNDTPLPISNLF